MFFDLFNRKKKTTLNKSLSEEDKQWDKMWEMWANGEIESPYNELMTYQSEVNNGGHPQYFDNTENVSDIIKDLETLSRFCFLLKVFYTALELNFLKYSFVYVTLFAEQC